MLKRKLIGRRRRPKRFRLGSCDEIGLPKAETEEQLSDPTLSESQPGSGSQVMSLPAEVPNDKTRDNSGAKIQISRAVPLEQVAELTQPFPSDGEESEELIVRIIGDAEQLKIVKEMLKTVMSQANAGGSPSLSACGLNAKEWIVRIDAEKLKIAKEMLNTVMKQIALQSFLSSGYSQQQGPRPRGPVAPPCGSRGHSQFSGYGYPQRAPPSFPSQNSQYPPPSLCIYPLPVPGWEERPPTSMHGPLSQDQYGKPPPMYNMQQPEGSLPHAQPFGQQQGPMRTNPYPPFGAAPASAGFWQTYPKATSVRGYSLYPAPWPATCAEQQQPAANNAAAYNGYQAPVDPAANGAPSQQGPPQAHQPGFYQSGGSGGVAAAAAPVVGAQQQR